MDPVEAEEEKKGLLVNEDKDNLDDPPAYGSAEHEKPDEDSSPQFSGGPGATNYVYTHRMKIPGYGLYRMLRGVPPYSHWVLFVMLVVYLLNQLDRYTLPIVTSAVGYDLKYGDQVCMASRDLNDTIFNMTGVNKNITDLCTVDNETSFYDNLDIK